MNKTIASLLAACTLTTVALGEEVGQITLFGQTYSITRLDYASQVRWADPLDPQFDVSLISCEGAHALGNDRLLVSMDAGDDLLTVKNWVVEIRIVRGENGLATGLEYVRTVVANDPSVPGYGGFDLSPCGVTVNTSTTGLAANGDLLIGDSEINGIRGYSILNGTDLGSFSGGTDNDSFDDLAFCPSNNLIYTINEDAGRLVTFTTDGVFVASTEIPGLTVLDEAAEPGSAKGMAYLADAATVPAAIRSAGGSMLVTLDDGNPGLQVVDLAGNVIATEALTDSPILGGGNSLLDQGTGCANPLQLEAAAFDAATGTLFLINESDLFDCAGFYILTPVSSCGCAADYNQDGGVDGSDVESFFIEWEGGEGCADVNQDGGVDGQDVESFFLAWEAGDC